MRFRAFLMLTMLEAAAALAIRSGATPSSPVWLSWLPSDY